MFGRNGWYKRRLPVLQPPPGQSAPAAPGATAPPPLIVRSDTCRGAVVALNQRPGRAATPPRPMPCLVVRWDQQRPGKKFRTPLIAAKINVAGGVIPPWVIRKDYQRGGVVYRIQPFLKEPPPPIAGAVRPPLVIRWARERPALVYLERPVLVPSPIFRETSTWISFYSETRRLQWYSWNRSLQWEPGMATYLTKRTAETRLYVMDFSELPELENGSLASVSSVVSTPLTVDANNLTIGAIAVSGNGKTATVWISGGEEGASYKVAFTVTVAGGTILEEFGYLLVEDE